MRATVLLDIMEEVFVLLYLMLASSSSQLSVNKSYKSNLQVTSTMDSEGALLLFTCAWMCCALFGALQPTAWRYAPRDWWSFPRQIVFWASIHKRLWSERRLDSQHMFLLQGIVDSKKLFWSVVCKAAGGVHDSTHLKESALYGQMKRGEVLARPLLDLQGETLRPYLIADSAYKARTFLVKPFRVKAGRFAREKTEFDKKLSRGRVKIENAFGLLKNRWRILRELNVDLPMAPSIVGACCLLHNYVQLRGEVEPSDQVDPHPNSDEPLLYNGGNPRHSEMALRVRGALFCHSTLQDCRG